ncbi:MAG TPA: M23 family metallopeptidase [Terriglobales bacterium]|nr:M23 family metallopeptidase [Terriglobales bacterium]
MKKIDHINFSILPDQGKGLNFRLSFNLIAIFVGIFILLLAFFVFLIFSYGKLNSQIVLNQALSRENKGLKEYNSKVKELEQELKEYRLFAYQVAKIAGVKFPAEKDTNLSFLKEKAFPSNLGAKSSDLKTQKIPIFSTIPTGLPLEGIIIKSFTTGSESKKKEHPGIDISARIGTEVRATADGVIDSVGQDKKYGNLVIINHENGYKTYYSSCSEIFAKTGDRVKKGDVIALSGRTGRPTPHLHYEIRKDGLPVDPSEYLESDSGGYGVHQ